MTKNNIYNIHWREYATPNKPEWMTPLSGLINTYVFCRIKQFNQEYTVTYVTKDAMTRKFHKSTARSLDGAKLAVNAALYSFIESITNNPITWHTVVPNNSPMFKFTHRKYRATVGNFEIATIYQRYNKFIICHNFTNIKTTKDKLTFKTLTDAKNFVEQQLNNLIDSLQIESPIIENNKISSEIR